MNSLVSTERSFLRTVDWSLVGTYLLLILIGWLSVFAAEYPSAEGLESFWEMRSGKQLIWIVTALVLSALILFALSPHVYETLAPLLYGLALVLLVAVIFLSPSVKGSHSWFVFGPVRFQPAELSKITTALMLAAFMGRSSFRLEGLRSYLGVAGIVLLPMLIIIAQQETGSALVYVGFAFVLYREGMSGWILALIGLAILLFVLTLKTSPALCILLCAGLTSWMGAYEARDIRRWLLRELPLLVLSGGWTWLYPHLPADSFGHLLRPVYFLLAFSLFEAGWMLVGGWRKMNRFRMAAGGVLLAAILFTFSVELVFNHVFQPHQKNRIEVLLGMRDDPAGVGYNVNQSMIAIGSGGLTGKGYMAGTQTAFGFVPEQCTDFIFCTIGEDMGFLGCLAVIIIYVLLIWRILRAAERSRENFTRIYGYCTASCFFMHFLINIGMTVGLMPVIGIPLPLISYGGSSLWAFSVMLFIFIALDRNERRYFGGGSPFGRP